MNSAHFNLSHSEASGPNFRNLPFVVVTPQGLVQTEPLSSAAEAFPKGHQTLDGKCPDPDLSWTRSLSDTALETRGANRRLPEYANNK